jgi:hypothetical protein
MNGKELMAIMGTIHLIPSTSLQIQGHNTGKVYNKVFQSFDTISHKVTNL